MKFRGQRAQLSKVSPGLAELAESLSTFQSPKTTKQRTVQQSQDCKAKHGNHQGNTTILFDRQLLFSCQDRPERHDRGLGLELPHLFGADGQGTTVLVESAEQPVHNKAAEKYPVTGIGI